MLMRVGLLLMLTGLTFTVAEWLGAIGPVLLIVGSGCAAVAFEAVLAGEQSIKESMAESMAADEPAVVELPHEAVTPTGRTPRAA